MAFNPQLFPYGMPVPFVNEMFVLSRDGVEFEVDKVSLPGHGSDRVKTKGIVYLSNIRMVFVAKNPVGSFFAFDMPLLYIHGEKFNQPIFHCNNISAFVEPVIPEGQHSALYSTHSIKILFKEGGCGTFIPLFFNLIKTVRQYNQQNGPAAEVRADPIPVAQPPVDEMMRHAYVDPNDPTRIFLQQPTPESQLRRRTYHSRTDEQIKSYCRVSRNLLIKFKDDTIDETSSLAQVLSTEAAISSMLDMSIRLLPGDHGLPLTQALPDIPPAMADAVNRESELLANMTVGTPWESVAREVGNTFGSDPRILRAEVSKDVDLLVDTISSWMDSNSGVKLLKQ